MKEVILKYLIFIFIAVLLFACKGEDGDDGKVYFTLTWSSDINSVSLDSVTKNSIGTIYWGEKYELEPGASGYVYWRSNTTWYQLWVDIDEADSGSAGETTYLPLIQPAKKGDDGKDRTYDLYVSGNTLYTIDERLEGPPLNATSESLTQQSFSVDSIDAKEGISNFKSLH